MRFSKLPFYNFHTHTHYSVQDAVMTPKGMVEALHARGHKYAALTEHGTLGSTYELWHECRERDMTPCLGCECYFVDSYDDPAAAVPWNYGHITVVAISQVGWQNLKILHDIAWRIGFKIKPRIQIGDLCKHNEGLVVTTGCMRGPVGYDLLGNDKYHTADDIKTRKARIKKRVRKLKAAFGPRLYGEVQLLELPEQVTVNKYVRYLAKKYDFPIIVTGDTHYLCKNDTDIHDAMICIGRGERVDDPENNSTYPTNQLWLKGSKELNIARKKWHKYISERDLVRYIKNTHMLAGLVENYELRPEGSSLPFVTKTPKRDARKLMKQHPQYAELMKKPEYKERLKYEMGIITELGFLDYFLMFDDILKYCHKHGIAYNARGSVCGSLVAYFMAITWIDPIVFNTPFERFLTSDRLTLPDIDMDLCSANRKDLVAFCERKYGERNVVYIGTSTTYRPKGLFKDLLKIHGFDFKFANRLTKPVDDKVDSWEEFSANPGIAKFLDEHEDIHALGPRMMGLIRNAGIHASGIVVTPTPCVEWLPVAFRTDKGDKSEKTKKLRAITEWDHNMLEDLDILKLDFLGVNMLDVVSLAIKSIVRRHKKAKFKNYQELHIYLYQNGYSDEKVYNAIGSGNTVGTFQLGTSDGMRELGKDLVPTNIYDIMAMISLYRTAILEAGMHAQYVNRRNGEPYKYAHPKMAKVLDHTYGVLIYQEDVMALSVVLAGFTPMEADHFRKGIKSKDKKTFAKWKEKFITGCQEVSGIKESAANRVWGFMEKFSGYGFNSSHAASYAVLAYITCWLKENYPVEYVAALLSCNANDDDRVAKYLSIAKKANIKTLPPCVNRSTNEFKIGKTALRYPLVAIKGLGDKAVEAIMEARGKKPFKSFDDFLERVNRRVVNVGIIQKLALAGAFCKFGSKEAMFDKCMKMRKNDKVFRQLVCLTCGCRYPINLKWEDEEAKGGATCPNCAEQYDIVYWEGNVPSKKKYRKLKFDTKFLQEQVFGYTTGISRLSEFAVQIAEHDCDDMAEIDNVAKGTMMVVAFEVRKVKKHTDKNSNQMAFIDITNGDIDTSIVMFASSWQEYGEYIAAGRCYIGKLAADGGKFIFADRRGSYLQLLVHKAK